MENTQAQFLRTLAGDVQHAFDRVDTSTTASDRRNLLRTIVSAVEGVSWTYRAHIVFIVSEFDAVPVPDALSEEQARYISSTDLIKLTTKLAKTICPDMAVDFGTIGWVHLNHTIRMRNRITHPKSLDDLTISDQDIDQAKFGFFWFLDTATRIMEDTLAEYSGLVSDLKALGQQLTDGDPDALDLYHRTNRDRDL
ncbi:MAG: hypothetical protein V4523_03025 [Pseudomonadota bacterium]